MNRFFNTLKITAWTFLISFAVIGGVKAQDFVEAEVNIACTNSAMEEIVARAQVNVPDTLTVVSLAVALGECIQFERQWMPATPITEELMDADGYPFQVVKLTSDRLNIHIYSLIQNGVNTR